MESLGKEFTMIVAVIPDIHAESVSGRSKSIPGSNNARVISLRIFEEKRYPSDGIQTLKRWQQSLGKSRH